MGEALQVLRYGNAKAVLEKARLFLKKGNV